MKIIIALLMMTVSTLAFAECTATVVHDVPTAREDGTLLPITELQRFKLYNLPDTATLANDYAGKSLLNLGNDAPGVTVPITIPDEGIRISSRYEDTGGRNSAYSEEVVATCQPVVTPPPSDSPPVSTVLTVILDQ